MQYIGDKRDIITITAADRAGIAALSASFAKFCRDIAAASTDRESRMDRVGAAKRIARDRRIAVRRRLRSPGRFCE